MDVSWVDQEAARIAKLIQELLSPHSLYLFGSASENKMTDQSDFDFMLVFESEAHIREARQKLRGHYPLSEYPVDLVWVTLERFDKMKAIGGACMIAFEDGRRFTSREHSND